MNGFVRCNDCGKILDGQIRKIELHHMVRVADRPDLRLSEDNIMVLCKPCHTARTIRGE